VRLVHVQGLEPASQINSERGDSLHFCKGVSGEELTRAARPCLGLEPIPNSGRADSLHFC
jgi:hypothetical protein